MGVRWMHQGRTGCDERTNEPFKKWDRHGIEPLLSGTLKPASGGLGDIYGRTRKGTARVSPERTNGKRLGVGGSGKTTDSLRTAAVCMARWHPCPYSAAPRSSSESLGLKALSNMWIRMANLEQNS